MSVFVVETTHSQWRTRIEVRFELLCVISRNLKIIIILKEGGKLSKPHLGVRKNLGLAKGLLVIITL